MWLAPFQVSFQCFDVAVRYLEEIKEFIKHSECSVILASWSECECLWGCWSTQRAGWKVNGIQEFPDQDTLESW